MKLNRREAEARRKIIQEYHLRKKDQLYLDRLIEERGESYYNVYKGTGINALKILQWVLMDWNMNIVRMALAETGVTARALAETLSALAENYNRAKEEGDV